MAERPSDVHCVGRPLTAAQHGIWLGQQLAPDSPQYNAAEYVELQGPLDPVVFEAALRQTVWEARGLHLRFESRAGHPLQYCEPSEDWTLHYLDFSAEPDSWQSAYAWMTGDLGRTLDLARGPLFVQALIRLGPERYLWYQRIHHIILDGYGFSLLARRVAQIYTRYIAGEPPGSSPFGDLWEVLEEDLNYRNSGRFAEDRRYWTRQLADMASPPNLAGRAAPATQKSLRHSDRLTQQELTVLQATAQELKAAWPDLLLATTATYLHEVSGASELVLGLPVMGRLGSAALRVPTMVMNIVALRLSVTANQSFRELVTQIVEAQRELRPHQRYRYEQLRRDLKRVGGERRLFGPVVNIMPFDYALGFGDIRAVAHNLSAGPVEDLSIGVYARGDGRGLDLDFDANPACYDPRILAAHVRAWRDRLTRFLCDPEGPTAGGRHAHGPEVILQGEALERPPQPVLTRIAEQVRNRPESIALEASGRQLSYAGLWAAAQALGGRLRTEGAGRNGLIAIHLPRSPEAVAAMLGVLIAGAGYVILDPAAPRARNAAILQNAGPALVLTNTEYAPDATLAADIPRRFMDETFPDGADAKISPEPLDIEAHDLAYAVYTSGSTGQPKGVMIEHGALAAFVAGAGQRYGIQAHDRILQFAPLHFDASVEEIFLSLCNGATLVLRDEVMLQSLPRFLSACAEQRISVLDLPTAFWHELAFGISKGGLSLPECIRTVIIGGEAALPKRVKRWRECVDDRVALINTYGPSEATVVATAANLEATASTQTTEVPIGRPLPGLSAVLLDAEGRPVPRGDIGELHLMGPGLARGYLGLPETTRERFVQLDSLPGRPRAYRSGDRARLLPDGQLCFAGRVDGEFKISGHRVDPGEIETALCTLPGIREAAVIGHVLPGGAKRLCAHLVADMPRPQARELRRRLAGMLPPAVIPAAYVFTERLPRTPSGKLDRKGLERIQPDWDVAGGTAPATELEALVLRIWGEVLGQSGLSVQDDFFDLGGQSLQTLQVANRLSAELGQEIPVATLFRHPNAAMLAEALGQSSAPSGDDTPLPGRELYAPVLTLNDSGDTAPLFCIHPAAGLAWCYLGLARQLGPQQPLYGLQSPNLNPANRQGQAATAGLPALAGYYLEQIRRIQPRGPYRLLGWSLGGMLAQAVAARLQQQGETVALLALLDAYPAHLMNEQGPAGEAEALAVLLQATTGRTDTAGELPQERTAQLAVLRDAHPALSSLEEHTLRALLDAARNNITLAREAPPPDPYHGDLLFFTAVRDRVDTRLHHRAWESFIEGHIENHDIDCHHGGMMNAAALRDIVPVLTVRLTGSHQAATRGDYA